MKHQKHNKLVKPELGFFHRNEWSILGSTCSEIQKIQREVCQRLSKKINLAFVDADHKISNELLENSKLAIGAGMQYTNKIAWHQFELKGQLNEFQYRSFFNAYDGVIVNGNHFKAKKQIVVIDERKRDSLFKKLDRLTDVGLILLKDEPSIYPFLKDAIVNISNIPIYKMDDYDEIAKYIDSDFENNASPLRGLVLTGGKSKRMGQDKGQLVYHEKMQREHVADLIKPFCEEVFLSCRADQKEDLNSEFRLIEDSFLELGPLGGIASAFKQFPDSAWLVIANDIPLLDDKTLQHLIKHRNRSKFATAFKAETNDFPEPLIAIWEPRAYPILFQFLTQGYSCPRKVLINSDIELIEAPDPKVLTNANTPMDQKEILNTL